uniref:Uncharacterized protein n=1 Tax=Leptobrachium leishanense TaxID=445787 RepID=A0A8C5QHE3_9ANUR
FILCLKEGIEQALFFIGGGAHTYGNYTDVPYYVPKITAKPLLGRLTNSGFVLEKPQCIFHQYPSDEVWLVIVNNSVLPQLDVPVNLSTPVESIDFERNQYFHIHKTLGSEFPCTDTFGNTADLLLVGSDSVCNTTFCNKPLSTGPFRAIFVVLNNNISIAQSRWSDLITLNPGLQPPVIPNPPRRSAGMIIIVVILSILLAILLACLIAVLATGSKDICWRRSIDNKPLIHLEMVRHYYNYNKHSVYVVHTEYKLMK